MQGSTLSDVLVGRFSRIVENVRQIILLIADMVDYSISKV